MHYACWCSRPNIYVHNVQEMKRKKLDKCFSDYFPHFIFLSHPTPYPLLKTGVLTICVWCKADL